MIKVKVSTVLKLTTYHFHSIFIQTFKICKVNCHVLTKLQLICVELMELKLYKGAAIEKFDMYKYWKNELQTATVIIQMQSATALANERKLCYTKLGLRRSLKINVQSFNKKIFE